MRTTGQLHIGNYFGALKNWIHLQNQYQCFFGLMDWHAMTTSYKESSHLDNFLRDIAAEWLAWGLDPDKCTLFVQSLVPEHLELERIFANLTPLGWLQRVPTWKDSEEEAQQTDTHNLARLGYPVLQTADISIYRGELVPVGRDQVAHLELAREIVRRFNRIYSGDLPEPRPLLTDSPQVVGTDGRKMSKSYANVLHLTEESSLLKKQVQKMITCPLRARRADPGDPETCPVFFSHKLVSSPTDIQWADQGCRTAGIGCGDCKLRLYENIETLVEEPRKRKKEWLNNKAGLDSIIKTGCEKARTEAQVTLGQIRKSMKFYSGGFRQ